MNVYKYSISHQSFAVSIHLFVEYELIYSYFIEQVTSIYMWYIIGFYLSLYLSLYLSIYQLMHKLSWIWPFGIPSINLLVWLYQSLSNSLLSGTHTHTHTQFVLSCSNSEISHFSKKPASFYREWYLESKIGSLSSHCYSVVAAVLVSVDRPWEYEYIYFCKSWVHLWFQSSTFFDSEDSHFHYPHNIYLCDKFLSI